MKRAQVLGCMLLMVAFAVAIRTGFSQSTTSAEQVIAEILSPKHGAEVSGTTPCPSANCNRIPVDGRVAAGYTPFLAVAPLNAAPRIWIQPVIVGVRKDGNFTGSVFLGTSSAGAGEKFTIFIFASKTPDRFREGQILMGLPKDGDVFVSDPVTVLRTK